jgi:hypothetical protein
MLPTLNLTSKMLLMKKSAHNLQTQTLRPKQKNSHPMILAHGIMGEKGN